MEYLSSYVHSYALWSIWIELSALPRLFLLILALVTAYTLFSSAVIVRRLISLIRPRRLEDLPFSKGSLDDLLAQTANLGQLIAATFYLFGVVFFFVLRFVEATPESKVPVGSLILENFFLYFAFAGNVFVVLLLLHSVQWVIASRIQVHSRRLSFSKEIA